MKRITIVLALLALSGSLPPVVATAAPAPGDATAHAISVGRIQRPAAGSGVKQLTVEVRAPGDAQPRRFVVSGPDKVMQDDERPVARVVGERLLVHTEAVIAVFDLATGRQLFDAVAAPGVVSSRDGRRIAWEEPQRPFTPEAASSSVVQVLDVPSLEAAPVFPERESVQRGQFGNLLAWEDDAAKRHSAGALAWSPDGTRLAFFCTHGMLGNPEEPRREFLTVVDVAGGPGRSRFVHRPFDWAPYLKRNADPRDQEPYFAVESITWSEDDTLVVEPPPFAWWLEDELVIPLAPLGEIERDLAGSRKEGA